MSETNEITLDLPLERDAGQLITAEDFNKLIAAVKLLNTELTGRIADLRHDTEESVEKLEDAIDGLSGRVTELEGPVGVLEQQYAVTLETSSLRYAVGEVAEITARVRDFEGNPLDMSGGRPWVDFMTAWGQFKPVSGFTSRGGVGDRTISVQVNNQGVAQVRLRAESVDGLTDEDDDVLIALLAVPMMVLGVSGETTMPASKAILESRTPAELQNNSNAYSFFNNQYQRAGDHAFGRYVDNYYVQNSNKFGNWGSASFHQNWNDYRSIVMVVAKDDSNPLSPDRGRGFSSIQITFRDWVSSWVHDGWIGSYEEAVPDYSDLVAGRIVPDYTDTVVGIKDSIDEVMVDKGVVGRLRDWMAIAEAVERIPSTDRPDFTDDVLHYIRDVAHMQQVVEVMQARTPGVEPGVASKIFGTTVVQQAKQAANVQEAIGGIRGSMQNVREMAEGVVADAEVRVGASVRELEQSMGDRFRALDRQVESHGGMLETHGASLSLLDGRTEALQQSAGRLVNDVSAVSGKVTVLENFNVIDVQDKMAAVSTLQVQLQDANREIGALREKIENP